MKASIMAATRFIRDERGTASMEFVVTLPLLLGPLILTAEYGQALSNREALDSAVADAVQLLAVAPALPAITAGGENDAPLLVQHFVDKAEELIADRLEVPESAIMFEATISEDCSVTTADPDGADRPFYIVRVRAVVGLKLGLLSFFNNFFNGADGAFRERLPILATDEARYISAVPPIDNVACTWTNIAACTLDINNAKASDGDTTSIDAIFPGSAITGCPGSGGA
ncbi:hypothetical protein LNKW23_38690 [Paralimibaculum aggregatum]|uniref:TadE-like domain-containing protein n=2 Tax=Paralimibaculum aggregatum TaxID=3036245 RepID=A0ABQ6LRV5_9RHOB|nr:hypothetical protein LNKW23_38690 [Limibaculum sp. NKW23]